MSAATFYNTLKTALSNEGYTEIPDLMDIEEVKEPHKHKGYILKPIGSQEDQQFTNKCLISDHEWMLQIVYKNNSASERVANYDEFHTLKKTLYALSDMNSYTSNPTFGRLANFTRVSVGTLQFYFGRE